MKKVLLSLITLIFFGLANAQVKEKGIIEITPKIGTSSFAEYNDDNDSTKYNSGIEFGVTTDYYFNNRWSLRSGLIFDKMGGIYNVESDRYEDKLNYLSVPINANWHFGSTRKWNLNIGLSPAVLLKSRLKTNYGIEHFPENSLETFQLGMTFGIGYKIEVTERFGILIDAQFFEGLTNFNNASPERFTNSGSSMNLGGVIQL